MNRRPSATSLAIKTGAFGCLCFASGAEPRGFLRIFTDSESTLPRPKNSLFSPSPGHLSFPLPKYRKTKSASLKFLFGILSMLYARTFHQCYSAALVSFGETTTTRRCAGPVTTQTGQPLGRAEWPLSRVGQSPTIKTITIDDKLRQPVAEMGILSILSVLLLVRDTYADMAVQPQGCVRTPYRRRRTALSSGAKPLGDYPCTVSRWTNLGGWRPALDSQVADAAKLAGIVGHEVASSASAWHAIPGLCRAG